MAIEKRISRPRRSLSEAVAAHATLQAKFFRGLGDPTRLRIIRILLRGPQRVNALVETLGMSQSRVSNHLACLKWCGYVDTVRNGRFVEYSVSDRRVRALLEAADAMVADNAAHVAACTRIDDRSRVRR